MIPTLRGTVTLAAALALPTGTDGDSPFSYRDLIVVCAFGVVLGTLVLQGLILRPLMLRLGLKDDGSVEREVQLARPANGDGDREAVLAAYAAMRRRLMELRRDATIGDAAFQRLKRNWTGPRWAGRKSWDVDSDLLVE